MRFVKGQFVQVRPGETHIRQHVVHYSILLNVSNSFATDMVRKVTPPWKVFSE